MVAQTDNADDMSQKVGHLISQIEKMNKMVVAL